MLGWVPGQLLLPTSSESTGNPGTEVGGNAVRWLTGSGVVTTETEVVVGSNISPVGVDVSRIKVGAVVGSTVGADVHAVRSKTTTKTK